MSEDLNPNITHYRLQLLQAMGQVLRLATAEPSLDDRRDIFTHGHGLPEHVVAESSFRPLPDGGRVLTISVHESAECNGNGHGEDGEFDRAILPRMMGMIATGAGLRNGFGGASEPGYYGTRQETGQHATVPGNLVVLHINTADLARVQESVQKLEQQAGKEHDDAAREWADLFQGPTGEAGQTRWNR